MKFGPSGPVARSGQAPEFVVIAADVTSMSVVRLVEPNTVLAVVSTSPGIEPSLIGVITGADLVSQLEDEISLEAAVKKSVGQARTAHGDLMTIVDVGGILGADEGAAVAQLSDGQIVMLRGTSGALNRVASGSQRLAVYLDDGRLAGTLPATTIINCHAKPGGVFCGSPNRVESLNPPPDCVNVKELPPHVVEVP